jgi:hypothetical protein
MDITLQTNSDDTLEMRGIELLEDNSAYQMQLVVSSNGFAGNISLFIEPQQYNKFIDELDTMNTTLSGSATMKPLWEDDYIRIECNKKGQLTVSCELFEHSDFDKYLKLSFMTDQTCLTPFIKDLKSINQGIV